MREERQVAVQIKIDKNIVDQLKKIAREKGCIFSAYMRNIILNSLEKKEKEANNG